MIKPGLTLSRDEGQQIDMTTEDGIRITATILRARDGRARIKVSAPMTVLVDRHEITERRELESHAA